MRSPTGIRKKLAIREEPVFRSVVLAPGLLGESDAMLSHLQCGAIKSGSGCCVAKIIENHGLLFCVRKGNTDIATTCATGLVHKPEVGKRF
ncbi:MAG: hypothetical protein CM15mP120_30490 [Pseudomonadota bacterium]|nr:MAG: hypothetical protein CM15mP120_30490 [Pseudomonadota bacterium]